MGIPIKNRGHIDGTTSKPMDPTNSGQWKINEAKMITRTLNSMDQQFVMSL